MRGLVIAIGDPETGSTKYRIVQYESMLTGMGISLEYVRREDIDASTVDRAAAADVVINQKCLFDLGMARQIAARSKRLIYDFDDAVYTRPGKPYSWITGMRVKRRLHFWLTQSDVVVPANEYLARYARQHSRSVHVIPNALDLAEWCPARKQERRGRTVIGWAGSPGNVPNLERLEPVLAAVLRQVPQAELAVFSGRKPDLSIPHEYCPYKPGHERLFVRGLDIGLLPLPGDEYAKGKSPIKAIQYLACGAPVVGNVAGATAEICNSQNCIAVQTDDEWVQALVRLCRDADLRTAMGEAGRRHAVEHHDLETSARALGSAILGLGGGPGETGGSA